MKIAKKVTLLAIAALLSIIFVGCGEDSLLDPANPVTVTIWHHYTGVVQNSFEELVRRFNETEGMELGIIVHSVGLGNVGEIERQVRASAYQEVGSDDLPNMFTSFPDTAYVAKRLGLLVDLDDYFSPDVLAAYFPPFVERGRIGFDGELHIFPGAKATEIMMVNHTDWQPFAQATGVTYDDLLTMEGLVRVAQIYYEWSDGQALFGRDQMGNFFIISSKQFGIDIKKVVDGQVTITVDEDVMRLIWQNYYIPHISGYFTAHGRFRSDDLRSGEILMYSGSTVSAAFFPDDVRIGDGMPRTIDAMVLPTPRFQDGDRVMVQQGAGIAVVKSTPTKQYASTRFMQWFTEPQQNKGFAAISGHLPVKIEAMDYELIRAAADAEGITRSTATDEAIRVGLEGVAVSLMYTPPSSFEGGVAARAVLDTHLRNKAVSDRATIVEMIADGTPRDEAIAMFATDENFYAWLADFTAALKATVE